jgi:hypothetical protein
LKTVYPEHQHIWEEGKPPGYWKDPTNQRKFFDKLATKLNIQTPEQWNRVLVQTVLKEGGSFVNNYYKGSVQKGV